MPMQLPLPDDWLHGLTKLLVCFSILYCYLWQGVADLSLPLVPHLRPERGQFLGRYLILDASSKLT